MDEEAFLARFFPVIRIKMTSANKSHMQNKCFFCCEEGHYVRECPNKHPNRVTPLRCERCGRYSHRMTSCHAKKHINGTPL